MIHPDQVAEMLLSTLTAAATATATLAPGKPVKPIPTVIPTPTEWQVAGEAGHRTLWVLFGLMAVTSAVFAGLSWNIPVSRRAYHVVTTLATIVSALSYFAMASGQGHGFHCDRIADHHDKVPDTSHMLCRDVFWARHVDWILTSPLLVLDLCLLAGLDGAHTLMAVAADLVMAFSGMFAGFGHEKTAQKWGWFTIACVSFVFVIWHVGLNGSRLARVKGRQVTRLFAGLGIYSFVVWTVYPIVWGVTQGSRTTTVDTEIITFAVLDVLSKVVFGFWLLLSQRSIPESNVEIGGYWSHGLASEGTIRLADEDA